MFFHVRQAVSNGRRDAVCLELIHLPFVSIDRVEGKPPVLMWGLFRLKMKDNF